MTCFEEPSLAAVKLVERPLLLRRQGLLYTQVSTSISSKSLNSTATWAMIQNCLNTTKSNTISHKTYQQELIIYLPMDLSHLKPTKFLLPACFYGESRKGETAVTRKWISWVSCITFCYNIRHFEGNLMLNRPICSVCLETSDGFAQSCAKEPRKPV